MLKKESKTRYRREVEALNAHAGDFNSEMEYVLQLQAETEPIELELPHESANAPITELNLEK